MKIRGLIVSSMLGTARNAVVAAENIQSDSAVNREMLALASFVSLRGGSASDFLLPLKWMEEIFKRATIEPLVKPTVILGFKAVIIAFITAEALAYMGVIGERGEGLYEWAVDNEVRVHAWIQKWGIRPGGFLRQRLEEMLTSYRNLPPRAKFASAVSTATTAFPLVVQTSFFMGVTSVAFLILAEFLAFIGVLGDPGEGISEWIHEHEVEPILHTFRRLAEQTRFVLKEKLKISNLLDRFVTNMKNDHVFWIGFAVGSVASMLLPLFYGQAAPPLADLPTA